MFQFYLLMQACHIRDFFMVMLTLINAARTSNIINTSIEDLEKAEKTTEIPGYSFKSKKYKTSLIYGVKYMWLPADLYDILMAFIKYVRPKIGDAADSTAVFISSKVNSREDLMSHSAISSAMTRSFQKAEVFSDSRKSMRVSASRLRCAVISELVGVAGQDSDIVALHFAKHCPATSRKYYMAHWSNREALRLSMMCYTRFRGETTFGDDIVKERNEMLKKPPPSMKKIVTWLSGMTKALCKITGEDFQDKDLMSCLNELEDECSLDDCKNNVPFNLPFVYLRLVKLVRVSPKSSLNYCQHAVPLPPIS